MVLKQEQEVAERMARREQEIMEAVRRREEEMARMWAEWEQQTRGSMGRAVEERMQWVQQRTEELEQERQRLDGVKHEVETKMKELEAAAAGARRTRSKEGAATSPRRRWPPAGPSWRALLEVVCSTS